MKREQFVKTNLLMGVIIILLMLLFSIVSKAQDKIIKLNGDTLNCVITNVQDTTINFIYITSIGTEAEVSTPFSAVSSILYKSKWQKINELNPENYTTPVFQEIKHTKANINRIELTEREAIYILGESFRWRKKASTRFLVGNTLILSGGLLLYFGSGFFPISMIVVGSGFGIAGLVASYKATIALEKFMVGTKYYKN